MTPQAKTECRYQVERDHLDARQWAALLADFEDANLYQSWEHGQVRWGRRRMSHLTVSSDGQVVAAARVRVFRIPFFGTGLAYVFAGPLWRRRGQPASREHWRQALRALREEYAVRQGLALRVRCNEYEEDDSLARILAEEGFSPAPGETGECTVLLDLTLPPEELRARLHRNWKSNLNKSLRHPFTLESGTGNHLFNAFADLYRQMVSRKQFMTYLNLKEYARIQRTLPDQLKMQITVSRLEGEPVAAAVCAVAGERALQLFMATGRRALETSASFYLLWREIEWLQERGVRYLDMGGIDARANPGGFKFKHRMGGREVSFLCPHVACVNRRSQWMIDGAFEVRRIWRLARQWLGSLRSSSPTGRLKLWPGETVQIKPLNEIRALLDSDGATEGLPFIEEMHQYCGRTFRVRRRADKTCVDGGHMRRMRDAVFLEGVFCDGSSHGGCAATCSLFWKEAWLKRADAQPEEHVSLQKPHAGTLSPPADAPRRYQCQATALITASRLLPWWGARQYLRDIYYGHVSLGEMTSAVLRGVRNKLAGRPVIPQFCGTCSATPAITLNLQPGEWVEIKQEEEIKQTLNKEGKNRGLLFPPELTHYCGGRYTVLKRVPRLINERTGEMHELMHTVLLAGVVCDGRYHRGCPRTNHFMCREIWLRRTNPPEG